MSLTVRPGEGLRPSQAQRGGGRPPWCASSPGSLRPHGAKAQVAGLDVARAPHRVKARIGYATQEQRRLPATSPWRKASSSGPGSTVPGRPGPWRRRPSFASAFGPTPRPWRGRLFRRVASGALRPWPRRWSAGREVLFLDRPTTGLDPLSRRSIWDLIHEEAGRGAAGPGHHPLHGRGRALPPPGPSLWGAGPGPGHPQELRGLGPGARARFPLRPGPLPGGPPGASGGPRGTGQAAKGQAHRPALLSPRSRGSKKGGARPGGRVRHSPLGGLMNRIPGPGPERAAADPAGPRPAPAHRFVATLMLLLFGYAIGFTLKDIPLVLYDASKDRISEGPPAPAHPGGAFRLALEAESPPWGGGNHRPGPGPRWGWRCPRGPWKRCAGGERLLALQVYVDGIRPQLRLPGPGRPEEGPPGR